jgi:hypothetical protein
MNMKGRITLHMKDRVTRPEKMLMANDVKSFTRNLEYCYENLLPATDPKVRELVRFWNNLTGETRNSAMRGEAQVLSFPDAGLFEYLQKVVKEGMK